MKVYISVGVVNEVSTLVSRMDCGNKAGTNIEFWMKDGKGYVGAVSPYEVLIAEVPSFSFNGDWENFSIKYDEFKVIGRKLKKGSIELDVQEANITVRYIEELWDMEIVIGRDKGGKSKMLEFPVGGWEKNTNKMMSLYRKAIKVAGKDKWRRAINGVFFDKTAVVGTDGRRMIYHETVMDGESFTVPDTKFLRACWLEPDEYQVKKDFIWFRYGSVYYAVSLISERYPDWKSVIPKTIPENRLTLTDDAILILEKFYDLIRNKHDMSVEILGKGKSVVVSARNTAKERTMRAELKGKAILESNGSMIINIEIMLDALKLGFREFEITDSFSPIVSNKDGWNIIMMPMRRG